MKVLKYNGIKMLHLICCPNLYFHAFYPVVITGYLDTDGPVSPVRIFIQYYCTSYQSKMIQSIILLDYLNNLSCPWESISIVDIYSKYKCVYWINKILDLGFRSLPLIRPKISCFTLIIISVVFKFYLLKNIFIINLSP